jgi:ribonuclease Z
MRPNLHPSLVNGRYGDPAVYVEMLHRRDALLFDLGDLRPLGARDLLRIGHVFVSHTHVDHFIGFDALLRVSVGREKTIRLVGPEGFCDRVFHKLQGYQWDLADRYETDLLFDVQEVGAGTRSRCRFRFSNRFAREPAEPELSGTCVARGEGFEVEAAILEHHGPCLGFAVTEPMHVNVWKTKLDECGLAAGAWLQGLKQAVAEGADDDLLVDTPAGARPLGELRSLVTIGRGQKIAYVTDVADTAANRTAIAALAHEADLLFIEAPFVAEDAEQARSRAHLTTAAAGEIARAARVRRIEPFHFSPRYEGEEERMLAEVAAAFSGRPLPHAVAKQVGT